MTLRGPNMETTVSNRKPHSGKWGLFDLLAMVGGIMPLASVIAALKGSGGSFLAYLLGVPSALAIGIAILWAEGKVATAILNQVNGRSKRVKNAVGFALLLIQVFWIAIGGVSGIRLAAFIVNRLKS